MNIHIDFHVNVCMNVHIRRKLYSEATKHEIHKYTYNIITVEGDNHITNKNNKLHSHGVFFGVHKWDLLVSLKWDLLVSLYRIFLCPSIISFCCNDKTLNVPVWDLLTTQQKGQMYALLGTYQILQ